MTLGYDLLQNKSHCGRGWCWGGEGGGGRRGCWWAGWRLELGRELGGGLDDGEVGAVERAIELVVDDFALLIGEGATKLVGLEADGSNGALV